MSTADRVARPSSDSELDGAERSLWFAWKRAHEVIRARVSAEVHTATGLSDPDVAILIHVADAGPVRQSHLAKRLGWDRTRLSHHVSRMETRGLVTREKVGGAVEVSLTDAGSDVVRIAKPIHAAAVREHLITPFTPHQIDNLRQALERISRPEASPTDTTTEQEVIER
ncbi:MarR family winged helix-turn-helix transcriptional regulator [Rhodococcus sp. G-MC3]|uniref:MarR family winged helix-turn-helix transcriptional regulator n=1 Tax=Rhodococcus sp. G-MC3 TaxID=3046209 RepID=UPI0024B9E348|nr:MarR family winged helix-turn-helix transcriptional regulator [Rhodococcus sp. G-MC3]MDJ0396443.1 MarR family winged helix-turn-helix transcriptional regulator [Rhodococcus sp. G-MC3]